jgi:hypothetical protein
VKYIMDRWLDRDELDFLGFRLISVRLTNAGRRELVVGVRPSPVCDRLQMLSTEDRLMLRGMKIVWDSTPIAPNQSDPKTMTPSDRKFLRSSGIAD